MAAKPAVFGNSGMELVSSFLRCQDGCDNVERIDGVMERYLKALELALKLHN